MKWDVFAACLLVLLAAVACSQGGQTGSVRPDSGQTVAGDSTGLVGLTGLDAIKGAATLQNEPIDVTAPLVERNTQVNGEFLDLLPTPTELAWAVYRVEPPEGSLLSLDATGSDTLYLMVADYEQGWVYAGFEAGAATIDLTELGDVISPAGYFYCGAACPVGDTGTLLTLQLAYDDLGPWNLEITTDEAGVTLTWDELDCSGYEIFRSTLADDPSPYLVGTVVEDHNSDGNTFSELVPEDESGRWVPENNDNGTAEDTTDDFPTVAPAVEYHYRVRAVLAEHDGPESPEVAGTVPWGDRNTTLRTLPDTSDVTRVFLVAPKVYSLTEAQLEWMANNTVGCTTLPQDYIDQLRGSNPDYLVFGSHLGYYTCPDFQMLASYYIDPEGHWSYPLLYGYETGDVDGAIPYLDRHEDWFMHDATSEFYNQRVKRSSGDENCYWMDLAGPWPDYLAANLLQLTGEDGFDGWVIDNCTSLTYMTPSLFEESSPYEQFHNYLVAPTRNLLETLHSATDVHSRRPLVVVDAYRGYGYPTIGEPPQLLDYSASDVILYSDFAGSVTSGLIIDEEFARWSGPAILDHQAAGRAVIMQCRRESYEYYSKFQCYCCYLLLRGSQTYFNCRDKYGVNVPLWYAMYEWQSGPSLGAPPVTLDDLKTEGVDPYTGEANGTWYYRREFANGSVVVIPSGVYAQLNTAETEYESVEKVSAATGLGVADDGSLTVSLAWEDLADQIGIMGIAEGPAAFILREKE